MFTQNQLRIAITCIFFLCVTTTNAQFFDSLQANVGVDVQFSSTHYQPLWLVANKYGTVADRKDDLSPYIRISNKHVLAEAEYQNGLGFYDFNPLSLSYGLSVYNNNHFKSTLVEEAYVKVEYKNWSLRAGRFEETSGDLDPELSTGSLGVSANALPIPKIGIAVTDYTVVPFTGDWVQFRGTLAHGWLGSNRYVQNSYYHEKTFFLRVGRDRLKFYGGIQHFVEWGGKRGDKQYDRSMQGFWNAFIPRDTDSSVGLREGDQRGVLQAGLYWENDNTKWHGYLQKPFEGKQDISLKNKSALAGFTLTMKNNYTGLQKIVCEIISTKAVNDHIAVSKRESYYNNNIYKTGWEYENNVIGTPLFLNRTRANKYFPQIQPFDWQATDEAIPGNSNIVSNRVFGVHLGVLYAITDALQSKTLITYTENYGGLDNHGVFGSKKDQVYTMQQISYDIKNNISVTAAIGVDFGQLSNSAVVGGRLGIAWMFANNRNNDGVY